MSLYNHLCPEQNIRFSCRKLGKNIFIILGFLRGIRIHPEYHRLRKNLMYAFFDLFRSGTEPRNLIRTAFRTNLNRIGRIAAVMTH